LEKDCTIVGLPLRSFSQSVDAARLFIEMLRLLIFLRIPLSSVLEAKFSGFGEGLFALF